MSTENEAAGLHTHAAFDTDCQQHRATAQDTLQPLGDSPSDNSIEETAERLKRLDAHDARIPSALRQAFTTLGALIRDLPTTDYLLLAPESLDAWLILREHDPHIFLIYRATVRDRCGRSVVGLLDTAINKTIGVTGFGHKIVALEIGELLQRDFPPMETLLAPWLRKQYLVMVHATRGVGKTHFGLAVAYAVAGGGTFLRWQTEKPRRVLYIDGEMPGAAMKERLAAIVESCPEGAEPLEGYFRIITPDVQESPLPDLGTVEGQTAFTPQLGDAELIVVDNLSSLVRSGVENEGESWLPVADWALARRKEGRAVIFIHHSGKNGLQRGSSRREDLLDVVINLRHPADYSPESGAQFLVRFEKSRGLYGQDVREIEAMLGRNADGAQVWTWREAEGATQDRVIDLAKLGMSGTDIAADLGVNKSTVSRHLKKAREAGLLPAESGNGKA